MEYIIEWWNKMTKEKFIELLRDMCAKDILFVSDDGCVNFYEGEVRAFLRMEGIE
jgi:hypothetical protein